jgi:predicted nucleic acid-binding protein
LIELLTEKVSLSSLNKIVNKDHTVLDILNNFSGGTNRTITNLLDVINETKNSIKRVQSMSTEDLTTLVNKILKKKNLPESTISKYIENGKPTEAKFNEIVKYDILDNIPGKTGWH